jgi:hypothetical protein
MDFDPSIEEEKDSHQIRRPDDEQSNVNQDNKYCYFSDLAFNNSDDI